MYLATSSNSNLELLLWLFFYFVRLKLNENYFVCTLLGAGQEAHTSQNKVNENCESEPKQ